MIPLHLTEKGLFLLDLNDLASVKAGQTVEGPIAETHNVVEPKETEAIREVVNVPDESISVDRDKHPKSSCPGNHQISPRVEHHKAICQTATEEDQFDKPFAKSLSVPRRSSHHGVLDEASSKCPDPRRGESTRCDPILHPGAREDEGGLRQEASWVHVPRSLDPGSTLDRLVCGTLSQQQEDKSCPLSPLRGAHGGEGRTHRAEGASGDSSDCSPSSWRGDWEALPQTKGTTKGHKGIRVHNTDPRADDSRVVGRDRDRGRAGINDSFEFIQEVQHVESQQVAHLETRMLHMENALTQVIQHLESMNNKLSGQN